MEKISVPTLVIDEEKCRRNIRQMAAKVADANIVFRPHFKTHQSMEVARWFREAGVTKITVSSLTMAEFFAHDGWDDILVAFPVNIREIERINNLATRIKLSILLAHPHLPEMLKIELKSPVDFYVKIDLGYHRSGLDHVDTEGITNLLNECEAVPMLRFKGFLAHAGNSYHTSSLNQVQKIYNSGLGNMLILKELFINRYPGLVLSWGDTPTCSLINDFSGFDEIRPGNFVFYDLTQFHLASCDWDHIAVAVAAPVVSVQHTRNEVVLYAGAVHLSKDTVIVEEKEEIFGEVVLFTDEGWERFAEPIFINRISQEHGIIRCEQEQLELFKPGMLVGIVPVHSCLSADLLHNHLYNYQKDSFIK